MHGTATVAIFRTYRNMERIMNKLQGIMTAKKEGSIIIRV